VVEVVCPAVVAPCDGPPAAPPAGWDAAAGFDGADGALAGADGFVAAMPDRLLHPKIRARVATARVPLRVCEMLCVFIE
jgi:hypothetical protein